MAESAGRSDGPRRDEGNRGRDDRSYRLVEPLWRNRPVGGAGPRRDIRQSWPGSSVLPHILQKFRLWTVFAAVRGCETFDADALQDLLSHFIIFGIQQSLAERLYQFGIELW